MLPPEWRASLIDMIRGARPLDGSLFAGNTWLDPLEQIGVYREQYELRMADAIRTEVPGLAAMLGDALDGMMEPYLAAHPLSSWSIGQIAERFADWLEAVGAPMAQVDMARLDAAVSAGFTAAEAHVLTPDAMSGPLRLAPPVRLLRLRSSVHQLRSAVLNGEAVPALAEGDFPLVVYRAVREMRHWECGPGPWALLACFAEGRTVEQALSARAGDPALTSAEIGSWFQGFAARGLLEPVPPQGEAAPSNA